MRQKDTKDFPSTVLISQKIIFFLFIRHVADKEEKDK